MAKFPNFGLGTYRIPDSQASQAVSDALSVGYHLIDTAAVYRNERGVGRAINQFLQSGHNRSQVFVTSKLSPRDQGKGTARRAFDLSLGNLGLDYMDCYLIHWPGVAGRALDDPLNAQLRKESWLDMEQAHSEGLVKMIGVSNYTVPHLIQLLEYSTVRPAVLQVEFHPCLFQRDLLDFCRGEGIQLQAYSSFGEGSFLNGSIKIPGLEDIARKHSSSVANVLLQWALRHDVAVIPKSTSKARMMSNMESLNLILDDKDVELLDNIDIEHRFCWDPNTVL